MKYNALINKMVAKDLSLTKLKKELVPLHVTVSQKSFNELQEDIVKNHKDLEDYQQLKKVDKEGVAVYSLETPKTGVTAIIEVK